MADRRDTLARALDTIDAGDGNGWLFLNAALLPGDLLAQAAHEQGFRPDYLTLKRTGRDVSPNVEGGGYVGVALLLTRARKLDEINLARAWNTLAPGAPLVVCGAKTDGVGAIRKLCATRTPIEASLSKNHAVAFTLHREGGDWPLPEVEPGPDGLLRPPGTFSADGPDSGSTLLLEHLDALGPLGRVADLGAGWGHLARAVSQRGSAALHLYEADHAALEAARANVPGATHHWHDVAGEPIAERFDAIVMNPPFHRGRAADPALGQAFIARAREILVSGGRLLMVANRQLPYEATLDHHFRRHERLAQEKGFKVLMATA